MQYRTFDSYVLFKKVHQDELGHLYRAGEITPEGLAGMRWLRVLDGEGVVPTDLVEAFPDAGKLAGFLKSANTATNPRFIDNDEAPGIAWDYVAAQPLNLIYEKVHTEGFPVPVDNALLIMEKIAMALSAGLTIEFGGKPVVHGFLLPSLIQVSNDGEAVVSGFGLGGKLLAALDIPSVAPSVKPYLAPEVIITRQTGRRGDIYSLGAILYHLLTGKPLPAEPDQRDGCIDSAELAFEDEPVPDDIKALLGRTLATKPEDRFSSAADFKKELDKLLYGGAYSPTTFNLALFMDRLFRAEIETEERERESETDLDVAPYLQPEPEIEPETTSPVAKVPSSGPPKGLWLGIGAAAVVAAVAITAVVMMGRQPPQPELPPTPSPEQIEEQRQANEATYQRILQEEMEKQKAEMEDRLLSEIKNRQDRIEQLQQRVISMEQQAKSGQESSDERREREAIQKQIKAEEEAQRQRETELEALPQLAEEQARIVAADTVAQLETAPRVDESSTQSADAVLTPQAAVATPTPVPPLPTPTTVPKPTQVPAPSEQATAGRFVDPQNVDALPTVDKRVVPPWSRSAIRSERNGVVIVNVLVTAQGQAEQVELIRADHLRFGIPEAAVAAVREYTFIPATKAGVNVKTQVTVAVVYDFTR
ncbi:MAG: hypothetical protein GY906_01160 [bacterium]|nr:hypothetical protein [bacterium]